MVNLNSEYMYLSNINWNIYINEQSKEILSKRAWFADCI